MISKVAARLLVLFHLTAVTLTASILPGSLSLTTSHTLNLTLPHNGTLWDSTNPPDPFPSAIPNSELLVIFSNYGTLLPSTAVDQAIQAGLNDCIYRAPSIQMSRRRIRYTEPQLERVNVKVTSRSMNWGQWNLVLGALKKFVSDWGPEVLNFNVVLSSQPLVSIGRGYIEDNADSDDDDSVRQS